MDEAEKLIRSAKQILQGELAMGGDFLPAKRNPLPAPANAQIRESANMSPSIKDSKPCMADLGQFTPLAPDRKADALEELKAQAQKCLKCTLANTRTNLVFGDGDANARLVFVGEAPGADEDATGRPFVGRAGQKLTEMIAAMGLKREDVYICNILKCRPPDNRQPAPDEVLKCWPFLIRQLQIIAPRVIVTLGNPATQNLLQTTTGITKLRGQWQSLPDLAAGLGGIAVMPTFHPSYIIRIYTPEVRKMVWDDLQKVMAKLGLKKPK